MPALSEDADEFFLQLLEAAQDGDTIAQGKLLQMCRPVLLRRARQMEKTFTGAGKTGSDFVQIAFYNALEEIKTFHGCTPVQLNDWLDAILCRTMINERRRSRAKMRDIRREVANPTEFLKSAYDSAFSPEQTAEQREECALVGRILKRLPPDYSEVLFFWGYGLSWAEIGTRMGRSADAARMLYKRAMAEFKEHFKDEV